MNCKSPLLLVLAILLSACSGAPETPKPGITEVTPGIIATGTPSEIPVTATETLPPTKTATATIEPSPTTRPYHFGLEQNMKVENCNKLTLNSDGTIPEDYLAQERAWIAANKPPFAQIEQFHGGSTLTYMVDKGFPLPTYNIYTALQDQLVSCATLPDGTIVFDAIVSPKDMTDRANVTGENIPVFHFAYPQASYDWMMENKQTHGVNTVYGAVGGNIPRNVIPSPTEALAFLTVLSKVRGFDIWVVAPALNEDDLTLLDPSLNPLSKLILLNKGFVSPDRNRSGYNAYSGDVVRYISYPDIDKIPLSDRLSRIVLPVLAISISTK